MIQQLNKFVAQISILAMLLSSDVHCEALLKLLKEMHVPTNITDPSFEGMVSLVSATNQVSFSNDELPPKERDHILAMHIVVKCFLSSIFFLLYFLSLSSSISSPSLHPNIV